MSVGLVFVSHSATLAAGVAELAAQMAPDVKLVAAGGLEGGGIGTDFEAVSQAAREADSGAGVVLLYDLGSAQMTAELAVEALDGEVAAVVVDAPLVEGAVAAAVEAQGGADRTAVAAAAAKAGAPQEAAASTDTGTAESVELTLRNDVGLHARPAALLVRALAGLDTEVTVRLGEQDADAHSVLALMSLGARQGDRIEVRAKGADAGQAVERVKDLVARDFDE